MKRGHGKTPHYPTIALRRVSEELDGAQIPTLPQTDSLIQSNQSKVQ